MADHLGISKKERKLLIEKMRGMKTNEKEFYIHTIEKVELEEPVELWCPKCGKKVDKLTRDHVIPKWFAKRFPLLVGEKAFKVTKKQLMCFECNQKKGAALDFTDEFSREYAKKVIKALQDKLDATEKSTKSA